MRSDPEIYYVSMICKVYIQLIFEGALLSEIEGIINGNFMNIIIFADDIVILARYVEEFQRLLNRTSTLYGQYGLKMIQIK